MVRTKSQLHMHNNYNSYMHIIEDEMLKFTTEFITVLYTGLGCSPGHQLKFTYYVYYVYTKAYSYL